ncbi:hypothetical protein PIIN_07691 [Serendipita indica DSM 11827]|uniref:Ubiquinol-cytochrome c chaperone domain-containing protein n=1 Tax=Serendipita indica (strain DSM 11827) TaxID=1109443 RepID=G4TQZ3_SERID|nr:hypothetical protein PIIN_07691 [Serendipita indica DSM 11827]
MNPISTHCAMRVVSANARRRILVHPEAFTTARSGRRLAAKNQFSTSSALGSSTLPPESSKTAKGGSTQHVQHTTANSSSLPKKQQSQEASEEGVRDDAPIPYHNEPSSWTDSSALSPFLRRHPSVYKAVKFVYDGMGLYAKQSDAVRHGKKFYMTCSERDIAEQAFVYDTCRIPQTFHTWFQMTNLHVWLLTVRIRALPSPHGRYILQALVDFFFQDIEDRLRALLGPRISERTITSYMKEYRELWNGSQLSLDVGLVGGDWELAGAIWRNIFDARGWNLDGSQVVEGEQTLPPGLDRPATVPETANQETTGGDRIDLVEMPQHIYTFVAYLRRELKRLESVPDDEILLGGDMGKWGSFGTTDEIRKGPLVHKELERWEMWAEQTGKYR